MTKYVRVILIRKKMQPGAMGQFFVSPRQGAVGRDAMPPGSASLHQGLFLVPPLRGSSLGGTSPPGSASLHLGLLMVPPLRGWGGSQVIRAKQAAT